MKIKKYKVVELVGGGSVINMYIYFFNKFVLGGEASRSRVCYQRGLPRLVSKPLHQTDPWSFVLYSELQWCYCTSYNNEFRVSILNWW